MPALILSKLDSATLKPGLIKNLSEHNIFIKPKNVII